MAAATCTGPDDGERALEGDGSGAVVHAGPTTAERVATATDALADALAIDARARLGAGDADGAIVGLAAALRLRPGRTERLRDMGAAYVALGDEASAVACYRGTVPDALDGRCFEADAVEARTRSPDACDGVEHRPVHAPVPVALRVPHTNGPPNAVPQFRRLSTQPSPTFVSVVERGTLWFDGFDTLVLNEARDIVDVQTRGNPALACAASATRDPLRLAGTACALDVRSGAIYYHWLLDVLPRIGTLEGAGIAIDDIDHWIVRADASFQRDTLARLGVPLERIVTCAAEQHVTADRLVVPFVKNDVGERPATALGLGMGPWVPVWLRERFVAPCAEAGMATRRLYISRAARGTRAVADEPALQAMLEARGFERVELETLAFGAQVRLLHEADIVLAPHGAGLANIVFCRPGALVVELFGAYVVPCYWALAAIAELEYACFLTALDAGGTPAQRAARVAESRGEGLEVDVDALATWLDPLLDARASG